MTYRSAIANGKVTDSAARRVSHKLALSETHVRVATVMSGADVRTVAELLRDRASRFEVVLCRGGETGRRTGLKIRARTLHDNAVTRNVLIRGVLAFPSPASACTTMQHNEADPALVPAPDFASTGPHVALASRSDQFPI